MIVSMNTQIIWLDRTQYEWKNDGANVAYSLGANNQKVYGDYETLIKFTSIDRIPGQANAVS